VSPQRHQRRAAWALVVLALGVVALVFSVWLVGHQATSDLKASEARARAIQSREQHAALVAQNSNLRDGCARAVARDFEAYGTNRDLAGYAFDAAKVWARDGRPDVARKYAARGHSAELRMDRIKVRLPKDDDVATVTVFCRTLYPVPSPSSG
jgi:hypothetical protein